MHLIKISGPKLKILKENKNDQKDAIKFQTSLTLLDDA